MTVCRVMYNVIKECGSPHVIKVLEDLILHLSIDMLLEIEPHERATYVVNLENDSLLGLPARHIRGAFAKDPKVVYQYCLS